MNNPKNLLNIVKLAILILCLKYSKKIKEKNKRIRHTDDHFLAILLAFGALTFPVVFLGLLAALAVVFFCFGAFGLDPDFLADEFLWALAFAGLDGVDPFAGDVVAGWAGASTFGGSATGAGLAFGVLAAFVALAFGALVLGAFGLLADLALDLLAFWDYVNDKITVSLVAFLAIL